MPRFNEDKGKLGHYPASGQRHSQIFQQNLEFSSGASAEALSRF